MLTEKLGKRNWSGDYSTKQPSDVVIIHCGRSLKRMNLRMHFFKLLSRIFVFAVSTGRKCLPRSLPEHRVCRRDQLAAAGRSSVVPAPAACSVAVELPEFWASALQPMAWGSWSWAPRAWRLLFFPGLNVTPLWQQLYPNRPYPARGSNAQKCSLKGHWVFWDQREMPGAFRCFQVCTAARRSFTHSLMFPHLSSACILFHGTSVLSSIQLLDKFLKWFPN